MALLGFLVLALLFLAIGTLIWVVFLIIVTQYFCKLFYSKGHAVIRDYHIYTPDINDAMVRSTLPLLILTLEGNGRQGAYSLATEPVDTATLLRTLKLPEQTPVFWYDKAKWDQLLLGQQIAVAVNFQEDRIVLHEAYRRARRDLVQFVLTLALLASLVLLAYLMLMW